MLWSVPAPFASRGRPVRGRRGRLVGVVQVRHDSDPQRACFTAHTAIDDPSSPDDAAARESIDLVCWGFDPGMALVRGTDPQAAVAALVAAGAPAA